MENADLLTNAAAALDRYRAEERALELELTVMQTRLELIREVVGALAGKPRARRGRPPRLVDPLGVLTASPSGIEMPLRVAGGVSSQLGGNITQPETDTAA